MRTKKSLTLAAIATAVLIGLTIGASATYADSSNGFVLPGFFQANLQVTAVTPTPGTGSCPFNVGDTFPGVVQLVVNGFGKNANESAVYRLSVNTPGSFTILEEAFPNLSAGSYTFGTPGTTLASGSFLSTYTKLDSNSVLAVNTLTFTSPIDDTTSCAETDQVTLIRTPL